ncbi:MAG: ABC transporter substrate-binding protein, partial [Caldilineaceae bacterium]
MTKRGFTGRYFVLALLLVAALVLAACGPRGPQGAKEEPTTVAETASEATEAPTETAAEEPTAATTEEGTAEAGVASAEDQPVTQKLGGTWCTDEEDVSTPREHLGGDYRDVASSDAVSFHPALTTDTSSSGYQAMVYSGSLLRLDEKTLEYIPNMAECYTISDDGLTFTFNLRQGMLWSDGEPITAQDFKWTY